MKQTWKVVKSVIYNNCTSTSVKEINSGGTVVKDPKLIDHKFNSYFTSIGPTLASKVEPTAGYPMELIDNNNTIFLYPSDVSEIKSIVPEF